MAGETVVNEVLTKVGLQGADKAVTDAKKLDDALDGVAVSSDKVEKATVSSERSLNTLLRRIDPTYDATLRLAKGQQTLGKALAEGLISSDEYARRMAQLETHYNGVNKAAANTNGLKASNTALKETGTATQLAAYQVQNLTNQFADLGVQIGSGQGIFRPLLQQGPQILDALGASQKGIGGALKDLGKWLAGLVTPARLVFGGLAGSVALAASAFNDFQNQQKSISSALQGLGRGSGLTVDAFNSVAKAAADASGISVSSATEIGTALLKTGKVGKDSLGGIIALARDFATTMGTDIAGATDELAKAFADPAKGAEELNQRLGFLDSRTLDYIRTLQAMGRTTDAQVVLQQKLKGALADTDQQLTVFGRANAAWAKTFSEAWDSIGEAITRVVDPSITQQLEKLQAARAGMAANPLTTPEDLALIDAEIDRVQKLKDNTEALAEAQRILKDQRLAAAKGDAITQDLLPAIKQVQDLETAYNNLNKALENPGQIKNAEATRQALAMVTAAMQDYAAVGGALNLERDKSILAHKAEVDAMQALQMVTANGVTTLRQMTAEEQASLAAKQVLINLLGSQVSWEDRLRLAEDARQKVLVQAQQGALQYIQSLARQADAVNEEIRLLGASTTERIRATAAREAEQRIIDLGIDRYGKLAQKIREEADALAEAKVKLQQHQEQQQRTQSAMEAQRQQIEANNQALERYVQWWNSVSAAEAAYLALHASADFSLGDAFDKQVAEAARNDKGVEIGKPYGGGSSGGYTSTAATRALPGQQLRTASGGTVTQSASASSKSALDVLSPINQMIDKLMQQQNAVLGRAYNPDPYADKNPDFFYSGGKIFASEMDKQYAALQEQIDKLRGIEGQLASQPSMIGSALVAALQAAGFGDLAAEIAQAVKGAVSANDNAPSTATSAGGSFYQGKTGRLSGGSFADVQRAAASAFPIKRMVYDVKLAGMDSGGSFTVPGTHTKDKPTLVGLRGGEEVTVITPEMKKQGAAAGATEINVAFHGATDLKSFRDNQGLIEQTLLRMVQRAASR